MMRRSAKYAVYLLLLIILIVAGQQLVRRVSAQLTANAKPATITIVPHTLKFAVDASGILEAKTVQNYGGPPAFDRYWQFKLINMVPEGKVVKKGDNLLNFDAQGLADDLQSFQNELSQAEKELDRTRVQTEFGHQELAGKLAEAQQKYEKLKLQQQTNPSIATLSAIDKDKLALTAAEREVTAYQHQIEWQQRASEASIKVIESKHARAENKVQELQRGLASMHAVADRDGVAVYKLRWNGEKFQIGETVWSGLSIMEIPDLNSLIAHAYIPEVDIGKIKPGLAAEIEIDALPGQSFTGHVQTLGRLIHAKSHDVPNKILDVEIVLDKLDTNILRPAMSVKTHISTETIEQALAVPLSAVRATTNGAIVQLQVGNNWQSQPVELGRSNGNEVLVISGLKAGDVIAADVAKVR